MYNICTDAVQKMLVMRYNQQSLLPLSKIAGNTQCTKGITEQKAGISQRITSK